MFKTLLEKCLKVDYIVKRYAGHSKWANIKHVKSVKDAERGLLFTRLSRQIKVAVQEGGGIDPKFNLKLSQVVDQCKRANMPQATLQNVLKTCQADKTNSKAHLMEIRGPGGCLILCEVFTHHLHSLKQGMSTILKKHQSKFIESGGALHLFEEKGVIEAEHKDLLSKTKDEQLELATDHAIESNAEEVTMLPDNSFQFLCGKSNFPHVLKELENLGYQILNANVDYVPLKMQEIGTTELENYEKLMKKLDDMPEVVRLFDNVAPDS